MTLFNRRKEDKVEEIKSPQPNPNLPKFKLEKRKKKKKSFSKIITIVFLLWCLVIQIFSAYMIYITGSETALMIFASAGVGEMILVYKIYMNRSERINTEKIKQNFIPNIEEYDIVYENETEEIRKYEENAKRPLEDNPSYQNISKAYKNNEIPIFKNINIDNIDYPEEADMDYEEVMVVDNNVETNSTKQKSIFMEY